LSDFLVAFAQILEDGFILINIACYHVNSFLYVLCHLINLFIGLLKKHKYWQQSFYFGKEVFKKGQNLDTTVQ